MSEFVQTASLFLKACHIRIDKTFFQRRIQSHPDYPALTSLTDTLDELGIAYSALLVDRDRVEELHFPALFHVDKRGKGDFEIVESREQLLQNAPTLYPFWDGITVTILPGSSVRNTEHAEFVRKKRSRRRKQRALLGVILLLALIANSLHFSPALALLSLLSLAGAFVCYLIILHSMGTENPIVQQLCSASAQNSCAKVLHSKAAYIGKTGLGDIGLVYFSGLFLFLSANATFNTPGPALQWLLLPSGPSLFVAGYSLFYQGRIAKAWCTMCLLVVGILILQAATVAITAATSAAPVIAWSGGLATAVLVAAAAFTLAASWFFIGPLLGKAAESEVLTFRMTKTKRNPDIFLFHLQRSEQVDTTPLAGDIVLGDPRAPLQLTIVSNPFCNPCAGAHKQLEQLLASHSDSIGLTIRFLFYPVAGINDDRRKEVVRLIHAACRKQPSATEKHPVDVWFSELDIEKFRDHYRLPESPDIPEDWLQPQEDWCRSQNISFTPTIYVNGFSLPRREYDISDIAGLLPSLTDRLSMPVKQSTSVIF